MTEAPFEYQPGVCNIDDAGVRFRKRLSAVSVVAGIGAIVAMNYAAYPVMTRCVITAGFGFVASLNFFQVKERFCVVNASKGTMEIGRTRIKITNEASRELDKKKRNRMLLRAAAITVLSGLLGAVPF
ncbi:MAG TPA: hypothetical protein VEW28_10095 [Candidatus Kapabacteria bacterium]|nr:hypothetical protein [Candidatus Kapabacteria bacterium]